MFKYSGFSISCVAISGGILCLPVLTPREDHRGDSLGEVPGLAEGCPRGTTQNWACRHRGRHAGGEKTKEPEEGEDADSEAGEAALIEKEDAVMQEENVTGEQEVSAAREQEKNATREQEVSIAREQEENATGEQEESTVRGEEDSAVGKEETENRGGRERTNEVVEEGEGGATGRTSQTEEQRGSKSQDPEACQAPGGTWISHVHA
ncbi:hypothetical protein NDU88_003675 [Pleurodeles waltl]|uniref:Uncharacterized protein n=1 Tax=Pleurodeles waltl TaxID=8319 RepID=A0AAV7RJ74_PLEWA|nr:hypothetical protein NDU88_003675 [Pleurodeles waltl]